MIDRLPRREREIFEIVCGAGEASAAAVRAAMREPPSHSAVRTLLGRLEARGLLRHRVEDQTYVYSAVQQPTEVGRTAIRSLVDTFFGGSEVGAATALLGGASNLSESDLDALQRLIDRARETRT